MSMPEFPELGEILTRDEAINSVLASIAMEEAALSHIINAEGEKIQYAVKCAECCDMDKVLAVNKSVSGVIEQITDLQIILKNKLRIAISSLSPEKDTRCVHKPQYKPCKPICCRQK